MAKLHLQLPDADKEFLQALVVKQNLSIKVFRRASALLALDGGQTLQSVATNLYVNYNSVAAWRDAYLHEGLAMLEDKPRSGRPVQIDGTQRAKITALACSQAPVGHARWSLRLLAEKVVELGYVDAISHTHVSDVLKKTNSSRT
jgi:transposase